MTENTIIFADGVSVYTPHEKAPDFVKYDLSIDPRKFVEFMKANQRYLSDKGYLRLTIKEGKNGTPYVALDTYKASSAPAPAPHNKEMQNGVEYHSPIHDAVGGYPAGPEGEPPF